VKQLRQTDAAPDELRSPRSGLRGRLASHCGARRSGDQFCVYVCDRFVLPSLGLDDLAAVGDNRVLLDDLTRQHIRQRYGFRVWETGDGDTANAVEEEVQRGGPSIGKPFLNPL
jgi:hypothetical protein